MNKIDILNYLKLDDFNSVFFKADKVRKENVGEEIHIRAILEYSNYCKCACKYCGLNCNNHNLTRYRLTEDEIIETGKMAYDSGYLTIVLQGGEDDYFNQDRLANIVSTLSNYGLIVTLSAGELSVDSLKFLYLSGAKRYLLKHETSNREIYNYLHPDSFFEKRINALKNIKKIGYETGSGFMIGLPNQTLEDIANDIILLKDLGCDMAGIGPFIPHPDTLIGDTPHGSYDLTLRAVALTRLLLPKINLPATTSLLTLQSESALSVFNVGANVIMRKVTPTRQRELYKIYPTENHETNIVQERKELETMIKNLGRIPK